MNWSKYKTVSICAVISLLICVTFILTVLPLYEKENSPEAVVSEAESTAASPNETFSPEQTTLNEAAASESRTAASAFTYQDQSINISAPYAGLYNLSTGQVLYEKNAQKKIYPASLTKILTAVTALTYADADTVITVGSESELVPEHSSLCLIKKGHKLTLYDLLTGMLVASGNDAAYTVAVNVARSLTDKDTLSDKEALSHFTDMMNSAAESIGCTCSHFTTPDGFDSQGQYTTVHDLMIICSYALCFGEIREIVSLPQKKVYFKSGENVTWTNSNLLLQKASSCYLPEATGMKTGTTPLAGRCLAATAEINSQTYLAIVAGCKTDDERYSSAKELFSLADSMQ